MNVRIITSEVIMKTSTFFVSVIAICSTFILIPAAAFTGSFTPGSNSTFDWTNPDELLDMLPTNSKPFLIYGYIAGEENCRDWDPGIPINPL